MDQRAFRHGIFSWNELLTTDPDAAVKFYSELFGWKVLKAPMEGMDYNVIQVQEEAVGGIMNIPPQAGNIPPCWGAYVTVDDLDASLQKAVELGAKIIVPATEIPKVGRFAVFADPQGAVLSMISYVKMDCSNTNSPEM